jgi:hypothetical protein
MQNYPLNRDCNVLVFSEVCLLCFIFIQTGTFYVCVIEERFAVTLEPIECFIASELGFVIYDTYLPCNSVQ